MQENFYPNIKDQPADPTLSESKIIQKIVCCEYKVRFFLLFRKEWWASYMMQNVFQKYFLIKNISK